MTAPIPVIHVTRLVRLTRLGATCGVAHDHVDEIGDENGRPVTRMGTRSSAIFVRHLRRSAPFSSVDHSISSPISSHIYAGQIHFHQSRHPQVCRGGARRCAVATSQHPAYGGAISTPIELSPDRIPRDHQSTHRTLADSVGLLTDQEMIDLARELSATTPPPYPRLSIYSDPTQTIAGSTQDQAVPDGIENPLWEIVRWMPARPYWGPGGRLEPDGHWGLSLTDVNLRRAYAAGLGRSELCARYTWSIPSPGDMAFLRAVLDGQGVVEIGAGSGYWAWQMTQAGIDTLAYDPHLPGPENNFNQHRLYHPVAAGDHEMAAYHPDQALMLCWPSYGASFAKQALHHYAGDLVVYVGEGEGGCCADDRFHRILARDFDEAGMSPFHVNWYGIHCNLTVWHRKAVA